MVFKKSMKEILSFVKNPEFQEMVNKKIKEIEEKEKSRIRKWNLDCRQSQINYLKTAKGKLAVKRKDQTYRKHLRVAKEGLTQEEKEEIRAFYRNRPKGYEVDHIYPLSKGGAHHIDNLQYLTRIQNRLKRDRILQEKL